MGEISIHAPLRGRPDYPMEFLAFCNISIHAPLRGRPIGGKFDVEVKKFQSTPPCGGDCQTGQLEFYKRFRLFSRKSVHGSPKPHFPVLVPSVRFPLALTAPWGPQGRRSSWLPSVGFCSDRCFPDYRTADCRGLCR